MSSKKPPQDSESRDALVADARRAQAARETSYRERALKMYPSVCGRCAREFSGKKLRELTVHHRDHDHDNNPPDGSNWELLCIYCHENEHAHQQTEGAYGEITPGKEKEQDAPATYKPFADLENLMKRKS